MRVLFSKVSKALKNYLKVSVFLKPLKKALLEDIGGARFYSFWIVKRSAVMAGTANTADRCRTDPVRVAGPFMVCLREQAHHEGPL